MSMYTYDFNEDDDELLCQVVTACAEADELLPHLAEFMENNGYLDANCLLEAEAEAMIRIAERIRAAYEEMLALTLANQDRWINHYNAKDELAALAHAFAE